MNTYNKLALTTLSLILMATALPAQADDFRGHGERDFRRHQRHEHHERDFYSYRPYRAMAAFDRPYYYGVGDILPYRMSFYEPRRDVVSFLPPVRVGTRYVQIDNNIYLITERSHRILSAMVLIPARGRW